MLLCAATYPISLHSSTKITVVTESEKLNQYETPAYISRYYFSSTVFEKLLSTGHCWFIFIFNNLQPNHSV